MLCTLLSDTSGPGHGILLSWTSVCGTRGKRDGAGDQVPNRLQDDLVDFLRFR